MLTFKEFYTTHEYVVEEGIFRNLATGALIGASLFSQPANAAKEHTYNHSTIAQNISIDTNELFAKLWAKYYNAEKKDKTKWALSELKTRTSIPTPVLQKSIDKAAYCFEGDSGLTRQNIKSLLLLTGRLESNYSVSHLQSPTGAMGYWQVLGSTAYDLLHNSESYFGPRFRKMFGKNALIKYQKLSKEQLKYKLKTDSDFCALIAAAKWVQIGQVINNKQTKQLNHIK